MAAVTDGTTFTKIMHSDGSTEAGKFKLVAVSGNLVLTGRVLVEDQVVPGRYWNFDYVKRLEK